MHLLTLGDALEVPAAATSLYGSLGKEGIAILLDDRDESAGSTFADADLLGMPLRVTVGRRTVQQGGG